MKETETGGRETKGKSKRRNRGGDRKAGCGFMRINIHRDKECETNTGKQRHRNAEQ